MFGLPRLDERYAWISMIERLAQGDITKFEDVYQMSVEESYYLLEYWKVRDEWILNTHLRPHEPARNLLCRLLLEKTNITNKKNK